MATTHSMTIFGSSVRPVDIECRLSGGLPQTIIVGLAGRPVAEAKDRLRAAFATRKLAWPKRRLTINLLPADLPKSDSGLDLALAASILLTTDQLATNHTADSLFLGEIGLDGRVLPVKGLIGKLAMAGRAGIHRCYIPSEQLKMAKLVPGLELYPLKTLTDLANHQVKPIRTGRGAAWNDNQTNLPDLVDVAGQYRAKRALEIAAAGQHHLFMIGPPGGGKTLLSRCLAGLLPSLTRQQFLEINQIHGLADTTDPITLPPVREPHHSIRPGGLLGGNQSALPGEISLAHQGVLILNELPEFSRVSLEALRQPLEDHFITRHTKIDSGNYPADCLVAATANPCACGFFGSDRPCNCSPSEVQRYNRRVSGPLLDRFDLFVSVNQPANAQLFTADSPETSQAVKCRVAAARLHQLDRSGSLNGRLTDSELRRQLHLTAAARKLLSDAADRLNLSSRGVNRCLRVARTIADLADSDKTDVLHLAEALQFRPPAILTAAGAET